MSKEPLESAVRPPSASNNPNYNRLSAMIENYSLHESLDDEIYMPSKGMDSAERASPQLSYTSNDQNVAFFNTYGSPQPSPDGNRLQLNGQSPGNRESIISAYSGTVHEGVPVSYIVKNNSTTAVKKENFEEPALPPFPTKSEWSAASADALSELTTKPVGNSIDTEEPQVSLKKEQIGQPAETDRTPTLEKNNSLKLVSMEMSHQKVPSSIASGNLASESGHSYNASATSNSGSSMVNLDHTSQYGATGNSGDCQHLSQLETTTIKEESYDEQQQTPVSDYNNIPKVNVTEAISDTTPLNISQAPSQQDISQVSEIKSIASSILPPLETQVNSKKTAGAEPELEIISDLHPTVPPRSARRPKSHIFIKESLDDIQNQLAKEMGKGHNASASRSERHSRQSSVRSESFFSATEQDDTMGPQEDGYTTRPLPSIPSSSSSRLETPENQITQQPNDQAVCNVKDPEDDDDYEDIVEKGADSTKAASSVRTPQSKLPKAPKKGHSKTRSESHQRQGQNQSHNQTKKIGSKHNKELRSFDIDTISQLLNVTKGTLIGSEFSNLGMKIEEKRALERLVDSLSRLTADMVLDPEKYQEGLRRLERATKALDGF